MIGEGGTEFEEEMAKELDLKSIVGSGNKWYSKLDLKGKMGRWSLKFTRNKSFVVDYSLIDEAVDACEGPGGDGSTPIWLFRIGSEKYDMIMLRKNDFKMLQEVDVKLINIESTKTEQKKKRASIPQLFRGGHGPPYPMEGESEDDYAKRMDERIEDYYGEEKASWYE